MSVIRARGRGPSIEGNLASRLAGAWRALAASALALGIVALEAGVRGDGGVEAQVTAQLLAFGLFVPAAWLCWRGLGAGRAGVVVVVVLAVAMKGAAFAPSSPPPLTTDTYRYAWDARVQAAGVNPYRHAPASSELQSLRDDRIWPNVNRKSWTTVYPPGTEAAFLLARTTFGPGLRATTWLFLLAEAAAVGLVLLVLARSGAPLERVALLAWHPLAVSEIAGNGHADALAVLACAGLLAAWAYGRRGLAGAAVGAGALFKLGPVLLVPALARGGGRRFVLTAAGVIAAGYLAYASAGTRVVGSIFRYLDREDLGSLGWWALQPVVGREEARLLLAVALLALVAVVAVREHETVEQVARSALLVLGGVLLAAAYLQPWYALWLLPFLVVTPAPGWLWLTGTLPLLYVFGIDGSLPWWIRAVVYGPFAALAVRRLARPTRSGRTTAPPLPERPRVGVVIPVLDEAEALPGVLRELPARLVDDVVVVDGGSRDGTPELARATGARVVTETRPGYGLACCVGAEALDTDVVVWLDGDGSDDPAALEQVLEPVLSGRAALSLGVRAELEAGAQHWHQRVGNRFVSLLVRCTTGEPIRDIPPMRALQRRLVFDLGLCDTTYGWPTEMVVKTARAGLPIVQVDVPSRARRGGRSKVSGRAGPSLRAGVRMLGVVARYA